MIERLAENRPRDEYIPIPHNRIVLRDIPSQTRAKNALDDTTRTVVSHPAIAPLTERATIRKELYGATLPQNRELVFRLEYTHGEQIAQLYFRKDTATKRITYTLTWTVKTIHAETTGVSIHGKAKVVSAKGNDIQYVKTLDEFTQMRDLILEELPPQD